MNLDKLLASGKVRRWHANPDMAEFGQTLGDHQFKCYQLYVEAFGRVDCRATTLLQVLTHDAGELGTGDLPYPFKQAHPVLAAAHRQAENKVRFELTGLTSPTGLLAQRIKYVDRLEAYLFVKANATHVLEEQEWQGVYEELLVTHDNLAPAFDQWATISDYQTDELPEWEAEIRCNIN